MFEAPSASRLVISTIDTTHMQQTRVCNHIRSSHLQLVFAISIIGPANSCCMYATTLA